ncbi:acyl-CoA synthetases/AMP-acid ligases II [Patellaria atrata CBS 101060]|uniref:Acyl-CoA synthetases/AMP-acid ligases II n=1 Tax=Patellaria atrata CBS 101060 TaxID=1346257 RepID=A0A9P4S8T0_9PEZI|nr:acyl-CoA synthetases/AMP-acid ligases II [Patellaria atrata CBS 101060]
MRVYRSYYPPPHVPTDVSISQYLEIYNPDFVANDKIIFEDDWTGRKLTYGSLRKEAAKGAWGLKYLFGIQEGDVVGICAFNSVNVVLLINVAIWAGATAALFNPLSTSEEIEHYLEISHPKLTFVDDTSLKSVESAICSFGSSSTLGSIKLVTLTSVSTQTRKFDDLFHHNGYLSPFDLSSRDNRDCTAAVCFSSGTSGKPKGVELSHHNLIASLAGIRSTDPIFYNSSCRSVFFAPLCHIYGLNSVVLMGAYLGYYTMVMKRYSLAALVSLSAQIRANTLRILPSIAVALTKAQTLDLTTLCDIKYIICSGAVLPPEIIESLQKMLSNAPIFQGYGMTETNVATLRPDQWQRVGSVGRLFANVEARIVDDDMNDVAHGEQGEMLIRGPTVFRRYMNDPKSTEETFHQGWMRTGDVVRCDDQGFWYLTERKKELIKYKGFQVAPAELEAILAASGLVDEAAVCALWDEDEVSEVPIAYVVLTEEGMMRKGRGEDVEGKLRDMVDSKVAPYKRLRGGAVVIGSLPKTGSGKVLKRMLPARLAKARKGKL